MTVNDFLLNMNELKGKVVAVHGEAVCDSPDLCTLRESGKILAFDISGLPGETRRRILSCGNPYHCQLMVTGLVQGSPNFGALLVAREVE